MDARTRCGRPSCSAKLRASRACCAIIPSTSRWPEMANSSPTRNLSSGELPVPISRSMDSTPRTLRISWSYFPAFIAMSSPNHFACS